MNLKSSLTIVLFFGLVMAACDTARMSSHNNPLDDSDGGQEKAKCGVRQATYAVYYETNSGTGSGVEPTLVGALTPWKHSLSPVVNYNYRSSGADTLQGPKPSPLLATHFIYEWNNKAYLYILYDGFFDSNEDASVLVDLRVIDNGFQDEVIFSDEMGELRIADYDTISTIYRGEFNYKRYSDGGIIGPLEGDQWQIEIRYQSFSRIESAAFFNVNGKVSELDSDALVKGQLTIKPALLNKCDFAKF